MKQYASGRKESWHWYFLATCGFLVFSTGCATDRSFDFPPKGEVVTIRVKSQDNIELKPMRVIYRSTDCSFYSRTAAGTLYEKSGYNELQVSFERQGVTDNYIAILPLEGGGDCRWRLSNATISFGYKYPSRFGDDLIHSGGDGITVLFDENKGPRGGADKVIEGNVLLRSDYYLWVYDGRKSGRGRSLFMLGQGPLYQTYEALQATEVYYEPVLHSEYVAYLVSHGSKRVGSYPIITYPDGTTGAPSTLLPDFIRLQCIRLPAECKKRGR